MCPEFSPVVTHQHIAVDEYAVAVMVISEHGEKLISVLVIEEDVFSLIAPAGDVIKSTWVFYS